MKREICAVVTKGALTEGEMMSANPEASYLLAVTESCRTLGNQQGRIFGICVVDAATSKVILGQVSLGCEFHELMLVFPKFGWNLPVNGTMQSVKT